MIPRPEHPRPQLVRPDWLSLNGRWDFRVGSEPWTSITLPFCPEAPLSGVGRTEPMPEVWYRRRVEIPSAWRGREVLLHFQAVDYDATVWAGEEQVAHHRGGFTPFTAELGRRAGELEITVRARDDLESPQPRGKQSRRPDNWSTFYTRTTGIWQTVWLEAVPEVRLLRPRISADLAGRRFLVRQPLSRSRPGWLVRGTLLAAGQPVAEALAEVGLDFEPLLILALPEAAARPWSPADPFLYDLRLEVLDANGVLVDSAASYGPGRAHGGSDGGSSLRRSARPP